MDGWGLLKGGMYVPSLKNRKKKVCLWWKVHLIAYPAILLYRHSTQIIMKQTIQIEHNRITNPNGREAAPVGYLQAWPRF